MKKLFKQQLKNLIYLLRKIFKVKDKKAYYKCKNLTKLFRQ
jgi:hypothetical protein